ncbi:hypothetical protein DmAi_26330 [Acetobacter persici]|uniref:Lipoyl-binding domain-containing protein n=1 Tax=Acetobacter persici TaxID=1076596 RepID=A0A6V8IBH7_9PROT|nr:hypothetical protein DmAi_26330 [Acetobacter persici]
MMRSPDDLRTLVALMRKYCVQTFEEKSGSKRVFLRLLPENAADSTPARPAPAQPVPIPLLSPEMGIFHLRTGITDGDLVNRGDIVAFVAVDLLMLPVIAPETGRLCLVTPPSNMIVGYHDFLGHILSPANEPQRDDADRAACS